MYNKSSYSYCQPLDGRHSFQAIDSWSTTLVKPQDAPPPDNILKAKKENYKIPKVKDLNISLVFMGKKTLAAEARNWL